MRSVLFYLAKVINKVVFIFTEYLPFIIKKRRYEIQSGQKINFVPQGGYTLCIAGDLTKFKIASTSHLKSDTLITIKDFVWLGANVTIVPGITIGEGAVVGAGSVVTKDVPDCAVVGGNPAKILKYRNKEKFYDLKKQGKYY